MVGSSLGLEGKEMKVRRYIEYIYKDDNSKAEKKCKKLLAQQKAYEVKMTTGKYFEEDVIPTDYTFVCYTFSSDVEGK
jgi:hypothetical protein